MSEEVVARIRAAIADHGPITFAEFMELALYGPGGFYERPPVGSEGHFVTSPHVHPIFAELLLRGLRELWQRLGRPEPMAVVEVGAGDGTLARDLLRLAETQGPTLSFTAVDRSPGAREQLGSLPIRVAERLADVPALQPGVVLANELLDNLPFRRVRGTSGGTVELLVGAGADGLVEVPAPCGEDLVRAPSLLEGQEAAVPQDALGLVDDLAGTLERGYALIIDYGSSRGSAGQIHGYRRHRVIEDVLADPGSADITAGVDLAVVADRARERGLVVLGEVAQAGALQALGFAEWNRSQLDRQISSTADGEGTRAVAIWQGRSRASILVDPTGLGRLRWLLLATPGLETPTWARAVDDLAAGGSSDGSGPPSD